PDDVPASSTPSVGDGVPPIARAPSPPSSSLSSMLLADGAGVEPSPIDDESSSVPGDAIVIAGAGVAGASPSPGDAMMINDGAGVSPPPPPPPPPSPSAGAAEEE
ncbi:unnamed protein product, partial [Ectocarpus sp. 12 AP-2014]